MALPCKFIIVISTKLNMSFKMDDCKYLCEVFQIVTLSMYLIHRDLIRLKVVVKRHIYLGISLRSVFSKNQDSDLESIKCQ